jgi:hemerythrin-like metal-binding protein
MEKYIWIEKYSVGVKQIDEQHQKFFEDANEIIRMTGQENIQAQDLLLKVKNFNDYAVYHFKTEEGIFEQYNYPDAEEQIIAHNDYREKMKEFCTEMEKPDIDTKKTAVEMAEFAGSWLANHVMAMDQKYIGFMHENGIN